MNSIIKKTKKMQKFARNLNVYTHHQVSNYKQLKPFEYTIALKSTTVETRVNGKLESKIKLCKGDYIICGPKNEKYGLPLEKFLKTYNLGSIENKPVVRNGFEITKKHIPKGKKTVDIVPSWGGIQTLKEGDYILMEFDNKKYYGNERGSFLKTYKKVK